MKRMSFTLLSVALLAGIANAALMTGKVFMTGTVFEANFTSGEGYSDGDVNGQAGFTESQPAWDVADSAATGSLENLAGNFARAQFGGNSLSKETVAIGDIILIEAKGLNIASDGDNNNVIVLGLSRGGTGGVATIAIGSQLTKNGSGDLFVENASFGVTNTTDTTFNVGTDTFDYGVKLTAETAGSAPTATYTVDHLINGTSILQETGITPGAMAGSSTDFAGFIQDLDNATGASLSLASLKISTVAAVPEP